MAWKFKPGVQSEGALVIKIAGMERFVPVLAMRQNRVIVPLMLKVLPLIEAAGARKDPDTGELVMPPPEVTIRLFSEDTLEVMTRMVYTALTRAYEVTLDEFLDEPVSVHELTLAMPVIVKQTAFFKAVEEGQKKASGEDQAAG
jgi:hypothetical protein